MTTDSRVDKLKASLTLLGQKIDQLLETQKPLIETFTRADQNASTAARGVANLTISTQKQFDILIARQDQLQAGQDELRAGQDELRAGLNELRAEMVTLQARQDEFQVGLDELRQQYNEFRQQVTTEFRPMNQKFDLIIELLRHR